LVPVKAVETAAKRQLAAMGDEVASSALAEAAILLARRLDGRPAHYVVPALVRELRLTMADLRAQAGDDGPDDLDEFLRGLSTPAFDAGH
jgi:hypothetical protein